VTAKKVKLKIFTKMEGKIQVFIKFLFTWGVGHSPTKRRRPPCLGRSEASPQH